MNSICYIVIIDNEDLTEFNKYNLGLIDKIGIFEKICTLPKDLSELFYDKESLISNRMSGVFNGYNVKFLQNYEDINDSPFDINIVFASSISDIKDIKRNVIILSDKIPTNIEYKIYNIDNLSRAKLEKLVNELVSGLDEIKKSYFENLRSEAFFEEKNESIDFGDIFINSIYTRSNLSVLSSIKNEYSFERCGFEFEQEHQIETISRILSIKNHVVNNTHPPIFLRNIEFLVSDMSSNLEFLVNKTEYSANTLKNKMGDDGKLLLEAIKLVNQNRIESDFSNNKYIESYCKERQLIESLIAIRLSGNVSVNIKLPISNSSIFSKLKDIGVVDRGGSKAKLNKLMLKLVNEFKTDSDFWFDIFNEKYCSSIKLMSNLPIEWSHHNGLPLMIRHEVSRIPVSPGYVSTALLLDTEQVLLKIDNFKKIKIISSFSDDDPIKDDLKNKLHILINELNFSESDYQILLDGNDKTKGKKADFSGETSLDISLDWINVSTIEELVKSLSNNDSAITIFDFHGGHDESSGGVIQLKDEVVSIYDLIGKIDISPIVILSSCDTSPIDRNHLSTANAFFLAGAKTVLASALPIMSHEASLFIYRLLLRMKHYLPAHLGGISGTSIRWSSFVTGMIRQTFYSELLFMLEKKSLISTDETKHLLFHVNITLNPLSSSWHEKILEEIGKKTGKSRDDLKAFLDKEFMMPECLKYVQLGNPESIIIAADGHIPLEPVTHL